MHETSKNARDTTMCVSSPPSNTLVVVSVVVVVGVVVEYVWAAKLDFHAA